MNQGRRLSILLALAGTLLLAACGQMLPTAPDDADDGYDDGLGYDGSPYPSSDPMDDWSPDPGEPTPEPSPTASAPTWTGASNDFRRNIGKGFLRNWLHAPRGVAAAGNLVFVADANRSSLRGMHGAVLTFDGMSEDSFSTFTGMYYERLMGTSTSFMLDSAVQAVAVSEKVVLASDAQGVKGFIRAIPENVLNNGLPIAPPCRDMAFAGGVLYMAQSGQVAALTEENWTAAAGLNVDAQGLGSDAQGRLWVVSANRIGAYQDGERVLEFDGRGTDETGPGAIALQDVAVDPRNGDVYALDRGQVLRFDDAGRYLGKFGGGRIGRGVSIAVGADGSVYVSDAEHEQVYQYRPGT